MTENYLNIEVVDLIVESIVKINVYYTNFIASCRQALRKSYL